jgi:hypothetical protein
MSTVVSGVLACQVCSRESGLEIEIGEIPELEDSPKYSYLPEPLSRGRVLKFPAKLRDIVGVTSAGVLRLSCHHLTLRQPIFAQEYLEYSDGSRVFGRGLPFELARE